MIPHFGGFPRYAELFTAYGFLLASFCPSKVMLFVKRPIQIDKPILNS